MVERGSERVIARANSHSQGPQLSSVPPGRGGVLLAVTGRSRRSCWAQRGTAAPTTHGGVCSPAGRDPRCPPPSRVPDLPACGPASALLPLACLVPCPHPHPSVPYSSPGPASPGAAPQHPQEQPPPTLQPTLTSLGLCLVTTPWCPQHIPQLEREHSLCVLAHRVGRAQRGA